jgi:murein DD-endopeptidase MepM/ murein hydrolase activator NlpD
MTGRGRLDRLQIVAATATLTSAVWIVIGTVHLDRFGGGEAIEAPTYAGASVETHSTASVEGDLLVPVTGARAADLVDSFDQARGERRHEAIDIPAPEGTAVIAAAPGTVEKLHFSNAGGNTIYVRSGDRQTIYYYAHLAAYAPNLREGQPVARGQPLGEVGSTGNADPSAPHLHFAILRTRPAAKWWEPAGAINPFPLLRR